MWPRRQATTGNSSAAPTSISTSSTVLTNVSSSSVVSSHLSSVFLSRTSIKMATKPLVKLPTEAKVGIDDTEWLRRALDKKKHKKVKYDAENKIQVPLDGSELTQKLQQKSRADRKGCAFELALSAHEQRQLWRKNAVKKPQDNDRACAKQQERYRQEMGFNRVFHEVFRGEEEKQADEEQLDSNLSTKNNATASSLVGLSLVKSISGDNDDEAKNMMAKESELRKYSSLEKKAKKDRDEWGFASSSNAVLNLDDFDAPSGSSDVANCGISAATKAAEFEKWKTEDTRSSISDNFVRLNMRKRFKGSSGRAKKRPAYLRARNENLLDEVTGDNIGVTLLVDAKSGQQCIQGKPLLADDGIDFIEECIEALAQAEKAGGLLTNETLRPSQETQPLVPPRCYHALVCQRLEVKKRNKNCSRRFFACPLAFDEGRCNFFLWEDDHVPLALQTLFTAPSTLCFIDSTAKTEAIECVPLDIETSEEEQRDAMLTNLRIVFGHATFRPGQQWAISRVLHRQDTLLVLPTGAGKSLCYQFPALFLSGITLVISPLISLMNDQYESLPAPLKARAVCLFGSSGSASRSSSKAKHAAFVRDLLADKLSLIFLSPEKALGAGMQALLAMPRVRARLALVCVDEAHCISEWSHHFRPSYLRLAEIFRHAQCVLCVTATASRRVVRDVLHQLRSRCQSRNVANKTCENESNMVLQMPWQRKNLALEVRLVRSNDERLQHLVHILPELSKGSSQHVRENGGCVIVYVHQQRQTEELAGLLREQLPSSWRGSGKVMAFHAGMSPKAKEKVRTGFARGRVRVVVATVAFGMGIDKKNVRAVVHFHMPSSVEGYVQQIGRAGRDGKAARALLYLLHDDAIHYRSLLFSTALHRDQLLRLLTLVLHDHATSATSSRNRVIAVKYYDQRADDLTLVSLERDWLERHLDLKAATIETFLTLLALETQHGKETNEDNTLRVVLQPLSMSWCTLQLLDTQAKKLMPHSCAKLLLEAAQRKKLPNSHLRYCKDGYLSSWTLDFHLHEAAQWYERTNSANRLVEKNAAVVTSSGAQRDGETSAAAVAAVTNERHMLQELRAAQQAGRIQRLSLSAPAFQVQLSGQGGLSKELKAESVKRWTTILYAKHEQFESRQLARLAQLYGALHAAALPTPSPTALKHKIEDDKDEIAALEDKARALEIKLMHYFDDDENNDHDEDKREIDDKHHLQKLLRPLTSSLIESIERDTCSLVQLRLGENNAMEEGGKVDNTNTKNTIEGMKWTSYSVAKIFHGLATPQCPIQQWRDHFCWHRYPDVAFERIVQIAQKVLDRDQTRDTIDFSSDKDASVSSK